MSNIVPFENGRLPAAFANHRSSLNEAAQAGVQASFAVVSFKGKVWAAKYQGNKTVLKDAQGQPVPSFDVVVVGVAPIIGKRFYLAGFTEGNDNPPDCFSTNGVTPDTVSPHKQAPLCQTCAQNQFGSRVSADGRGKGKACRDGKRIAVVPAGDLSNEMFGGPMMLDLAPTTLRNFDAYARYLNKMGAPMEAVVTRMSFDFTVSHPVIQFKPVRFLDDAETVTVIGPDGNGGLVADPIIERMLYEPADVMAPGQSTEVEQPIAGTMSARFAQPARIPGSPVADPSSQTVVAQPVFQPAQPAPSPATVVTTTPSLATTPVRRKSGSVFQGTAPTPAPAPSVAEAAATPAPEPTVSLAPTAPVTVIQQVPSDLAGALDSLLGDFAA